MFTYCTLDMSQPNPCSSAAGPPFSCCCDSLWEFSVLILLCTRSFKMSQYKTKLGYDSWFILIIVIVYSKAITRNPKKHIPTLYPICHWQLVIFRNLKNSNFHVKSKGIETITMLSSALLTKWINKCYNFALCNI